MKERDHVFAKHPKTRFIGAHFNWYGNDLGRAARQLDTQPNVYLEVAAVLYEFGRQPYAAAQFFTKYQDRVLFGKDTYETSEYPYYWRVFETHDEYFDYYRPLPRVLEAVRHGPVGRRPQEALLPERAEGRARSAADRLAAVGLAGPPCPCPCPTGTQ